jgi:hypothetical protein
MAGVGMSGGWRLYSQMRLMMGKRDSRHNALAAIGGFKHLRIAVPL